MNRPNIDGRQIAKAVLTATRLARLSCLSAVTVLGLAATASAATVTVNTTATNTSGDGLCGLIEAVQAVNQGSTYRNCTYTPNGTSDRIVFTVNGTHTVTGGVTPTRSVEIMGRGQANTILTSSEFCTVCSLNGSGTTRSIWLRDMTIQITNGLPVIGVWVDASTPDTIATTNVRITGFAIGISATGSGPFAQLNTTTLENNGTGLSVSGARMQVTFSTIRNNTINGIYLSQQFPNIHYNSVSDTIIQNNTGTDGAGIYAVSNEDSPPTPTLDITNCTFSGNQATGNGGGLYVQTMTNVTSSVFDNNKAGGIGGGFVAYERDGGYLVEIESSTFKNNRAAKGAGFSNYGPSDGQRVKATFRQSTFGPSNIATGDGGGIYSFSQIDTAENLTIHGNQAARGGGLFHDSGGESHLFHCTVTGNKATQSGGGGGLWLRTGNPRYAYNIFAENKAGSANAANNLTIDPGNASLCASYNLLDNVTGIASVFPTTPIAGGCDGANIVANAQLDTFKNLGGPTSVRPLLASSPALDAIPGTAGDSTGIDQRNWLRPIDGNFNGTASSDIGAVEANSTSTMHEAELLTVAAQSGETLTIENHASYSGGKGRVKQANLNGFVTLQTTSIQAGTYGVIVWFKKASNAGKFKLFTGSSSNPTAQLGGETDAYRSSAQGVQWTKVNLGTITVSTTGAQYFKFVASAKNASSSAHWMFLDAVQLYRSN